MKTENDNRLESTGRSAIASIVEMVAGLSRETAAVYFVGNLDDEEKVKLFRTYLEETETEEPEDMAPDSIHDDLIEAIEDGHDPEGFEFDEDEARDRISEDPLSFEVRSGWTTPGAEMEASEFCLLLSTGGPAVRIIGDVDGNELSNPTLQVQDWGTPWTDVYCDAEEREALETYIQQFSY